MEYQWYDFVGNAGVLFLLGAFLGLQMGKLKSTDIRYSVFNVVGASLIVFSLCFKFNMSAFLIEFCWMLIAIYGLIKWKKNKNSERIATKIKT